MNDDEERRRAEIRDAILRYLTTHPRAQDAVAGICEWWLPSEGVHEVGELVRDVLDAMAAEGLVEETELADGTRIYGRAQAGRNRE